MATSTPGDSLVNPESTDQISPLEAVFASLTNSIQAAFNRRQLYTFRWTSQSQQNAQAGMRDGDSGYRTDTKLRYERVNGAWVASDTDWIAITGFQNGFSARPGMEPRYRILNGVVWVEGELYRATTTALVLAFTMPAGARPRGLTAASPVPSWGIDLQYGSSGAVQLAVGTARTTSTGYPIGMSYIPA